MKNLSGVFMCIFNINIVANGRCNKLLTTKYLQNSK